MALLPNPSLKRTQQGIVELARARLSACRATELYR